MANDFADRLRKQREQKGLSQAELAEKAGLQVTAISHFETGGRSPSFDNLRKLADALAVTSDYLIGRSDQPELSAAAAGQLFRKAKNLSAADLEIVEEMNDLMAKRNRQDES